MFCKMCGKKIAENAKFCPFCGANQISPESLGTKNNDKYSKQFSSQNMQAAVRKKKSKAGIWIFIILIALAAVTGGIFAYNAFQTDDTYTLKYANKKALKAYEAIEEWVNESLAKGTRPQDWGNYMYGVMQPGGDGMFEEILGEKLHDGYVQIIEKPRSDYYDKFEFYTQWCGDESGYDIVGQYPSPIEKEYEDEVIFGTIFDPMSLTSSISSISDQWRFFDDFENYFEYEYNDNGEIIITKYIGDADEVYVPNAYKSTMISEIGDHAFDGYRAHRITKLVIAPNISNIGESAFSDQTELESVYFYDETLITIERYAFCDCTSLQNVHLPNTLDKIDEYVFAGCTSLKSIEIPDTVEKIGKSAFLSCDRLKSVKIPRGVEEIDEHAFWGCDNLEKIKIPSSVKKIGKEAFGGCDNLKEVDASKGYRFIGKGIFTYSYIFFKYLIILIAVGVIIITIVIILLVRRHIKRKRLKKAKQAMQTENLSSNGENTP